MTIAPAILAVASAASEFDVARQLADGLASPHTVLARVWLATPGILQLAGSAGNPTGGGSYARLDGTFSTIGIGEGKIGRIAESRTSRVVPNLRGDEDWLANPGWVARQGVRSFAGYPLTSGDHLLGVMAIFDRARLSTDDMARHELLARLASLRLMSLRERDALLRRLSELEALQPRAIDPPAAARARSIITRGELRTIERETLEAALGRSGGRVFGPRGAAILLGMKPTTLTSRMLALGIPSARAIRRRIKEADGSAPDR